MPRYEWTGGPNILGALNPGVQVSGGGGGGPTILRHRHCRAPAPPILPLCVVGAGTRDYSMVGKASWVSAIVCLAGLVRQGRVGRVGFRLRYG